MKSVGHHRGFNSGRRGFTFAELAFIASILGLVSTVAISQMSGPIIEADAARVGMDMRLVRQAAVEYVELSGDLPGSYEWGEHPQELTVLSDTTHFGHKDVEYRLWSDENTGKVEFRVRYHEDSPVGMALTRYRRSGTEDGSVSWTPTETTFRLFTATPVSKNDNGDGND